MTCGYIIWRDDHAHEERLRRVTERANVASYTFSRRVIVQDSPGPVLSGKGSN